MIDRESLVFGLAIGVILCGLSHVTFSKPDGTIEYVHDLEEDVSYICVWLREEMYCRKAEGIKT